MGQGDYNKRVVNVKKETINVVQQQGPESPQSRGGGPIERVNYSRIHSSQDHEAQNRRHTLEPPSHGLIGYEMA
jgi:hypothetical protein